MGLFPWKVSMEFFVVAIYATTQMPGSLSLSTEIFRKNGDFCVSLTSTENLVVQYYFVFWFYR
jgi:hypothetical protein